MTPFWSTQAIPVADPVATAATTWASLQLCTTPGTVPSHTCPLPWAAPKPEPAIVTTVPGTPLDGVTLEIVAVATLKGTALDQAPFCCTWTLPDAALEATAATICPSLQLTTAPRAVPSHTVPVPCAAPKPEPETATCTPAEPDVGETLEMLGGFVTVKGKPLLARPPTVTTTLPVLAPVGTTTPMWEAFQKGAAPALVPWKVTVLLPWLAPKLLPAMTMAMPTGPEASDSFEMLGNTVKGTPLLATPLTVTTTFPVVAPLGTFTAMLPSLQLETAPVLVPLKATVLLPWVAAKPLPVMTTAAPTGPEVGDRLKMLGWVITVKGTPLLAKPLAVTTTFPVVAPLGTVTVTLPSLQLEALPALVPLKVTVLLPWLAPKPLPAMARVVPTHPEVGDRLKMLGGTVTVKGTPLLARPLTAPAVSLGAEPSVVWRMVALDVAAPSWASSLSTRGWMRQRRPNSLD